MANDPRLERYLSTLELALRPFPVSDRAEIITEIKSHVLSALERDPETRLDSVLGALGEPETVANRYLMERGMKPAKTSIHPIVKWLVIGFLGTFAMLLVFAGFLLTRFDSLIKIDGKHGKVQVLGGLIDIDGDKDRVSIRGVTDHDSAIAGTQPLKNGEKLIIHFTSGNIDVATSSDRKFNWACKGDSTKKTEFNSEVIGGRFDLGPLGSVKCKLEIPEGFIAALDGEDGKIELDSPRFDLAVKLGEGKVAFRPADGIAYVFDVAVGSGKADAFTSSSAANVHKIEIHVAKGRIQNNAAVTAD